MASQPDDEQPEGLSARFFQKLASGVPGVLFTYWLSADHQSHRYPYYMDSPCGQATPFDFEAV